MATVRVPVCPMFDFALIHVGILVDDKMNGDVNFVTADEGVSEKLAYVDPNTNRAILKVDNVTTVPYNEKRKAVRITSKDSYDVGSLWVADILHAPYGVSSPYRVSSGSRPLIH